MTSGTEKTLNELRQDTLHRALLEAPLARADQALTRVRSMERAGDTVHAALLRAVADKWLALARDLVRTADMEAKAEAAERTLDDLETKMVRGRALLEETVARRGRAQETLEQLEKTPRPPAGKTKPEAPKKAPAATPSTESEEPRR